MLFLTARSDDANSAEFWDIASCGIWKCSRERVRWTAAIKGNVIFCLGVWVRQRTDQDWGSHEEVIKGVVQQVEAGGRVEICITHQLAGEQSLSGAAAQEAPHLAVGHVHSVGQHLPTQTRTTSAKKPGQSVIEQEKHLKHKRLSWADVVFVVSVAF